MKVPDSAKCVFKGIIFDVYQWQQKMFDGSFETFEVLKRLPTIEIIAVVDDQIIILEQEQPNHTPFYSLASGRGESNEEPLATAKRELVEETGYSSDDWELFTELDKAYKIEWKIYLFIAKNCKKIADQNLDSGEKINVRLVSFVEFLDILESDKFWGDKIKNHIFRIRQDKKKLEEFKKQLFRA